MDGEHLSTEQLERYRRRLMMAAELLAADAHLAGCRLCREAAAGQAAGNDRVDSLLAGFSPDQASKTTHLAYGQLEGFVDGTLDAVDSEIVESHLAVCGECKADWLDLDGFRKSLAGSPAPGSARESLASLWESTAVILGRNRAWAPLRAGAAVAAAAVVIWVASIPFRSEVAGPPPTTAESGVRESEGASPKPSPAPAAEVVALNDAGGRVALRGDGSIAGLGTLPQQQYDAVGSVLAGRPLALPNSLAALAAPAGTLLGGDRAGAPFELSAPVGTAVISDRPKFRWHPLEGARRYEVSVYDDSYTQVAASPPIEATEWVPPRPLAAGRVYSWQVKAFRDGEAILSPRPPAPEARFRVLDRKQSAELGQARDAHPDSHLLLAILYAGAGALDDAEREAKALAVANPQSPIPQRLLEELSSARRR